MHQRGLRTGGEGLGVLRPVVQIERDLVLVPAAGVEQELGEAVGSCLELGPGDDVVTVEKGRRIGDAGGDGFPDVGVGPPGRQIAR